MAMQFRAPAITYYAHTASRRVQTQATTTKRPLGGDGEDDRKDSDAKQRMNDTYVRHDPDRDRCPVFQWMPAANNSIAPLDDVRDIYEICQEIKHRGNRESIYIVNNLSMEGVEAYLHTVQYFERCLRKRSSNLKKRKQM